MLTRRHIRVKVMQGIYALMQSKDDSLEKQQKFLTLSINNTYTLYLLWLDLFIKIHQLAKARQDLGAKKYLNQTDVETTGLKRLAQNQFLEQLSSNMQIKDALEARKLDHWQVNDEYVKLVYKDILASGQYEAYAAAYPLAMRPIRILSWRCSSIL